MTATPMTVRVPGRPARDRPDRLLLVNDPQLGDVAVRWSIVPGEPLWKCRQCGTQRVVTCLHTFAGAMHLAHTLLGLEPLDVTEPPTTEGNDQ